MVSTSMNVLMLTALAWTGLPGVWLWGSGQAGATSLRALSGHKAGWLPGEGDPASVHPWPAGVTWMALDLRAVAHKASPGCSLEGGGFSRSCIHCPMSAPGPQPSCR